MIKDINKAILELETAEKKYGLDDDEISDLYALKKFKEKYILLQKELNQLKSNIKIFLNKE